MTPCLQAIDRHTEAATHFFRGLLDEYPHAIASGKTEAWNRCAISIVELLSISRHDIA
jgi:hypothetical protein